jgi:hypothetical protein
VRKGPLIVWEDSLGPYSFEEPIEQFPLESKSDFTRERPLKSYDNRTEDWPKCRHGEDCVVQMYNDFDGGGRRFFRCPRGFVFPFNSHFSYLHLVCKNTYWYMCFPDSNCLDNCGFTRWVDPPPIYPHQQYITYLQGRIFDLEYSPESGNRDKSEDDSINDAEKPLCNNSYC